MYSKQFWLDAVERALSTGAQAVLTVWTLDGVDLLKVNFDLKVLATTFALGAFYSFLKSLVASRTGSSHSASFMGSKIKDLQG